MTSSDSRQALREAMNARRLALPAAQRVAAAAALAERLRQLPALADGYVAGYWAVRGEISLHALLSPAPGFVYCLPCLQPGRRLRFAPWRVGDALVRNRYDIPEPDLAPSSQLSPRNLDAVLVPLLAFDRQGRRLGWGGGYYDRSFDFLLDRPRPARPLMIGVGYAFQECAALPSEPWDVPLDLIVTEQQTLCPSAVSPAPGR